MNSSPPKQTHLFLLSPPFLPSDPRAQRKDSKELRRQVSLQVQTFLGLLLCQK
jgi:hypothetical protein